jgi:hypothetical protein
MIRLAVNRNKKFFFNQPATDAAGIWISGICAVHCLLLPGLLSITSFSGLVLITDPLIENGVLIVSALLGISSLLFSYFRHHGKGTAITVLMLGVLLIAVSRFIEGVNEQALASSGAALVAVAHFVNARLCKHSQKRFE